MLEIPADHKLLICVGEPVLPITYNAQMPRFYFHVHDDEDAIDEDGHEFATFEEALLDAVPNARALAADHVTKGRLNLSHGIVIADAAGADLSRESHSQS